MKFGYMTNAFGPLVGSGGGVTNVKDVRYVSLIDDSAVISSIASMGYEYVEMFDGNLCAYENEKDTLRKILDDNHISLLGVYIGASFIYEDILEDELYRIEKVATLAKEFGARHIVLGGGAIRAKGTMEEDYVLLAKGLEKAREIVEKIGLVASYHPHLGSMAEKPEQVHKLFALTDIPFCPDVAHLVAGGGDALELVKEYYDRIKYIHLKDWNGKEFVPLGQGNAKIKEIVEYLKEKEYSGDWLVEIDGYSGSAEEACETSFEFLKRF